MTRANKRSLKRSTDRRDARLQIKGGVVPSGGEVHFHAYRVPGRGFSGRLLDSARLWAEGLNRVLRTGHLAPPKIVLERNEQAAARDR